MGRLFFPDNNILLFTRDIAPTANCQKFLVRENDIIKIGRVDAGSGTNTIQLDTNWPVTGQLEGIQDIKKLLLPLVEAINTWRLDGDHSGPAKPCVFYQQSQITR